MMVVLEPECSLLFGREGTLRLTWSHASEPEAFSSRTWKLSSSILSLTMSHAPMLRNEAQAVQIRLLLVKFRLIQQVPKA